MHRRRTPRQLPVLGGFPRLTECMERMYQRPRAPLRIAKAFERIRQQ
jgi:hypothetical protein